MSRRMNRLRLIFDKSLTCANALDKAAEYHPTSVLFHPTEALPYNFLAEGSIDMRLWLRFVNKIGNLLQANGLRQYDRVAIYKTNNIDYFFISLAIIKVGGIAVPINSNMNAENVEYYLKFVGAKFVFTDYLTIQKNKINFITLKDDYIWLFPDLLTDYETNCIDINKSIPTQSDQLVAINSCKDSIVLIVHTSGTTGFPKGVICNSEGIVAAIKGHYKSEPISVKNRIAVVGHYNHLVYYVGFFTSMLANMSIHTLPPENITQVINTIEKEKIDIFLAFPDIYLRMIEKGLKKQNLQSVKVWISTGDASHGVHIKEFCNAGTFLSLFGKKIMGAVFIDVIGTSEVGSGALRRIILPFTRQSTKRCIGKPFFGGPNVKVVDENGKKLPNGIPGRLLVNGKMLFKGCWNSHEALLGTVYDNWWWTGDWVIKNTFGQYYHLDRFADRILTSVGTIYSLLVEEILLTHPQILEAVVIGVPDEKLGQAAIAIVAPFPNTNLKAEDILEWVNQDTYLTIKLQNVFLLPFDEIPRGLTGKVLKRVLRKSYTNTGI